MPDCRLFEQKFGCVMHMLSQLFTFSGFPACAILYCDFVIIMSRPTIENAEICAERRQAKESGWLP